MLFRGRTVLAFVMLSMFASSLLTLTIVTPGMLSEKRAASGDAAREAAGPEREGAGGFTKEELGKLSQVFDLIQSYYLEKVDREKLVDGAIEGMVEALSDPFSSYMDPEEAKLFDSAVSASFEGIGAEVAMEDGKVKIVAPIKGSPAEKAGLQPDDVIVSVNGESLEGLTLIEAVQKIRGPKGTQARLGILRPGMTKPIEVIVVRDDIPVETVYAGMVADGIGKIEIRQFSFDTAKRFAEELESLEAQGMRALILDVRNNPGGLLESVLDIAGFFVPKGKPIVYIEDRSGRRIAKASAYEGERRTYPVVVLINGGSASASEILAGAIREAAGGTLIGETTFGKGTVQETFERELKDGSNLKLTMFKWLTPNGNWIHRKGIEPDIRVEQPDYYRVAPFSRKETLRRDSTGDDVRTLQIILDGLGLDPGRKDGYFDDQTELAVKAFQRLNHEPITGEVDARLMDKLERAIVNRMSDPKNDAQLQAAIRHLQRVLSGGG